MLKPKFQPTAVGVGSYADHIDCITLGRRQANKALQLIQQVVLLDSALLLKFFGIAQVSHFIHFVNDEDGRTQLVQVAQHPARDVLMAFLERVGRVDHVENQMRFGDVIFGDIAVLNQTAIFCSFLLVTEKAGGIDNFAAVLQVIGPVDF